MYFQKKITCFNTPNDKSIEHVPAAHEHTVIQHCKRVVKQVYVVVMPVSVQVYVQ